MSEESERLRQEKDDLSHEIIDQKLKGINGQLMSMSDTLHQRITDGDEKNKIEFAHIKEGIDQVLKVTNDTYDQTKKTNGRVTELERKETLSTVEIKLTKEKLEKTIKTTKVVRFMHEYPIITVSLLLIGYLFLLPEVREHVIEGVENFFFLFGKIF